MPAELWHIAVTTTTVAATLNQHHWLFPSPSAADVSFVVFEIGMKEDTSGASSHSSGYDNFSGHFELTPLVVPFSFCCSGIAVVMTAAAGSGHFELIPLAVPFSFCYSGIVVTFAVEMKKDGGGALTHSSGYDSSRGYFELPPLTVPFFFCCFDDVGLTYHCCTRYPCSCMARWLQ